MNQLPNAPMRQEDHKLKFVILALTALLALVILLTPFSAVAAAPQVRAFSINARQFAYEPATLTVHRGDTITLHLESLDAVHGLSVDGYAVNIQAEPGKSANITFVANKEGKWRFRCSVSCGALHPFMIGELNVDSEIPLSHTISVTLIISLGAVLFFWK